MNAVLTNLYPNPSFEGPVTGWAAQSGSDVPAASTDRAYLGSTSLKFNRGAGTATTWGVRQMAADLPGAGTYRFAARIWIPSLITSANAGIRIGGSGSSGGVNFLTAVRDDWVEIGGTFTWDGVGTVFPQAYDGGTTAGGYMYMDAVMVTAGPDPVDYFDGDSAASDGYVFGWTGTPHASSSQMLNGARRAIAAAAESTEAVTVCRPYYFQTTRAGTAWVQFSGAERDASGFGYMDSWSVFVVLPQTLDAAEKWADDNLSDLLDALRPELVITTANPQTLVLDSGTTPALVIEGKRARD